MGNSHHAKLIYGFELTEKEAQKISKDLELHTDFWISADQDNSKFFIEILSVGSVSEASYLIELKNVEKIKKKAEKVFDTSEWLQKNMKRENIKLLLICDYY